MAYPDLVTGGTHDGVRVVRRGGGQRACHDRSMSMWQQQAWFHQQQMMRQQAEAAWFHQQQMMQQEAAARAAHDRLMASFLLLMAGSGTSAAPAPDGAH